MAVASEVTKNATRSSFCITREIHTEFRQRVLARWLVELVWLFFDQERRRIDSKIAITQCVVANWMNLGRIGSEKSPEDGETFASTKLFKNITAS